MIRLHPKPRPKRTKARAIKRFKIICDPDKPCRSEHEIAAPTKKEALTEVILDTHDWLKKDNIAKVKKINRGKINWLVEVVRTKDDPPAANAMEIAIDPAWFWIEFIVEENHENNHQHRD